MKIIFQIILLIILSIGCNSIKKIESKEEIILDKNGILALYPPTYHCVRFNPDWIVKNDVESIIEREYLDGRNGKIHLVTILDYNSNGYLEFKHSGLSYPIDDSPNKNDIFSRWEYNTEVLDSFVLHNYRIVRFHDENGKMNKPDTLSLSKNKFNTKMASKFVDQENQVISIYEYDKFKRLVSEKNRKGEIRYRIVYHPNNKIEVIKFSRWHNKEFSSWITLDKKGRIIQNFDESNKMTHEFKYDDSGRMIEDKHWFEGKEPNYHTYEYKMKNSR